MYAEALEEFEDFDADGEMMKISRYAGIAACHEALEGFEDAAESYEKAATVSSLDVRVSDYLNNAARNYGRMGDKEKAIELYKKIKKAYPNSNAAREADRHISQLST
jgi:tetratricopeptide (TPR) repeat protein